MSNSKSLPSITWQKLVAAFEALGLEVVSETDYHVFVCRGATIIQAVQKMSPVPHRILQHLLDKFELTEGALAAALKNLT